ncbi:MAG: hypothetical protein MMC33_009438 [Icmadophila ericetorum]|nr:hypothetical protein [Icmadophila ericetorum]
MIPSLLRPPPSTTSNVDPEDPEDIFTSSLGLIFTDDTLTQHGNPGSSVIYRCSAFGDLELQLVNPVNEEDRKLFAQYVWNAGVWMAEILSGGAVGEGKEGRAGKWDWSVRGEKVLELGAGGWVGSGLGGIVSALAGAEEVTISDYPAQEVLANISKNVERNVPVEQRAKVEVVGHEWGVLDDSFSQSRAKHFTRILAADCLWMPWQHRNLACSMSHFLSDDNHARVWVIGGFHTGRAKLAPFFEIVGEEGLEVEDIWEKDVDSVEREWVVEREGEGITGRKRWVVIAIFRRKQLSS